MDAGYVFTPICYLQNRKFLKYVGQSILVFCLSGCLSVCCVCQSPTCHNFKSIFTKLQQDVEVVSTEKPIDLEVKGERSSWGQISKIIIFHPIDLKIKQHLHRTLLSWETNYFLSKSQRSTHHQTSKIINFQLKNCQFTSKTLKLNQTLNPSSSPMALFPIINLDSDYVTLPWICCFCPSNNGGGPQCQTWT